MREDDRVRIRHMIDASEEIAGFMRGRERSLCDGHPDALAEEGKSDGGAS